jgi:hypothetical protein
MYSGIIRLECARFKTALFRDVAIGDRMFIGMTECHKFDDIKAQDRVGNFYYLEAAFVVHVWNYNHQKVLIKGFRT